jgi:PHD/YefM family antitoxin component YafN of YafNO toxin-antitoxin module
VAKGAAPVVERLALAKARTNLGAVVERVRLNKRYVILEKDGVPVAGVMDIHEFEDYLELQDPAVREHIRKSQAEYRTGKSRPAQAFVAEVRRERPRRHKPRRNA